MQFNPVNIEKARKYLKDLWPTLLEVTAIAEFRPFVDKVAETTNWIVIIDEVEIYRQSLEKVRIVNFEPERVIAYPSIREGVRTYRDPDTWIDAILAANHSRSWSSLFNVDRDNWALATSVPGLMGVLLTGEVPLKR